VTVKEIVEHRLEKTKSEVLPRSFHLGLENYSDLETKLGKRDLNKFDNIGLEDRNDFLKNELQKLKESLKESIKIDHLFGNGNKRS
jgi:hypothetical protein